MNHGEITLVRNFDDVLMHPFSTVVIDTSFIIECS